VSKTGWKKLPEDVRTASILGAAACCFVEKGYHSASMRDVAKAAGLTKGGLYHHFPSKEAIRDALMNQFLDLDRIGLTSLAVEDLPAISKLERAGTLLLDGLATKNGSAPRFVAEAVACSGPSEAVTKFYTGLKALLVGWFAEAQTAGTIKTASSAGTLAGLYIALLDGAQIRADITGEQPDENPLHEFIEILRWKIGG
jgi:TetR/AcrR family transcriptional regulator, transcriptional repressor for nem operon